MTNRDDREAQPADARDGVRKHRPSRWSRISPFLRRDLRSRLASAGVAVTLLFALAWLGVSALTTMENRAAHELRVAAGIEHRSAVCGSVGLPDCSYDDREQAEVDATFDLDRQLRAAILSDLRLRVDGRIADLESAKKLLDQKSIDFATASGTFGDDAELRALLGKTVDLRPLATPEREANAMTALRDAAFFDARYDVNGDDTRDRLLAAVDARLVQLRDDRHMLDRQLGRDADPWVDSSTVARAEVWDELFATQRRALDDNALAVWTVDAGGAKDMSATLARLLRDQRPKLAAAVLEPDAALWQGAWTDPTSTYTTILRPSVRYHSPVSRYTFTRLLGATLLGLAAIMLLVVAPVCTATATAREREAGTLPVLRMTGMSSGDLALAMTVGSNAFALVSGLGLLLLGGGMLAATVGIGALLVPLALIAVFAVSTALIAVGLGDALGQRVNAMVVGGALAVALAIPGLLGAVLTAFDVAGTGMLLGPLPSVTAAIAELTRLHDVGLELSDSHAGLGLTMLAYAVSSQIVLGLICLSTWHRRVEHAWAPLFRPREGVALALLCVGSSALSLLDLSARLEAQSFDQVNLLTLLSTAYLLPMLGWLVVASLRRPARAGAVTSHVEARRAFFRFHAVLIAIAALVGGAYSLVLGNAGLAESNAELMWATLTQVLLAAETAVATGLLASRRRERRARIIVLGGLLVALQSAFAVGVYGLEVAFVAHNNAPALPFLLNMGASSYWVAFLLLLWTAGVIMILMALMADEREPTPKDDARTSAVDDETNGMPGRRLIH